MGYRASIVQRWSRRDRLAIVVIAVTVAFFTGATLVVAAVAGQTSQMAAEYGPVAYVTTSNAGTTMPVATLTEGGTYVGIPSSNSVFEGVKSSMPPADSVTLGTQRGSRSTVLVGSEQRISATVESRSGVRSIFPPDWYTGPTQMAGELGRTGQYSLRPTTDLTSAGSGTPLRGALAFFVQGTESLLVLLRLLTLGAAVLVAVTVYSVLRMVVRDRRETITVLRATGATPRAIALPFVARAGLLTLVGVLIGYAVGVVIPNAAINVAVFLGLPVSIAARVTMPALSTLFPGYVAVLFAGTLAGAMAVRPALRGTPLEDSDSSTFGFLESGTAWIPERLRPSLVGWRPFMPAVSALTVFVVLTLLLASVGAALAPVFAPGGTTVTEPGASHPVASTVPTVYANALTETGVTASPEILLFSVSRGTPFLSRGARFDSFVNVTDAELVAGREPSERHEAVIGADLAKTLDVSVGESIVLGGSTQKAFTEVTIVGQFEGSGITDDQLIVSLDTARHLSGKPEGSAQFIRLSGTPNTNNGPASVQVASVDAAGGGIVNEPVDIRARVVNPTDTAQTATIEFKTDTHNEKRVVELGALESTTVSFSIRFDTAGVHNVSVGDETSTVSVVNESAIQLSPLPDRAPPNSSFQVIVRTANGTRVSDATVGIDGRNTTTNADGVTTVRVPERTGTFNLTALSGEKRVSERVTVSAGATKQPLVSTTISPRNPGLLTAPTVSVTVRNPWTEPWNGPLTVHPPDQSERVSVAPGETIERTYDLDRQPPGQHTVTVETDGAVLAEATYQVTGDERVVSAIATRANSNRGTGISRAVRTVFGNLQVLLGTFIALGALVTIGSVTAGFAYAVRARRETIGILRATGAQPRAILWRVLADAVRVGGPAVATAMGVGYALAVALTETGYTTMFGITIAPLTNPLTIAAIGLGGLSVVVLGSLVAAYPLASATPGELLEAGENA
jgi:ABC-type lipoprotein release transport system permease subunit